MGFALALAPAPARKPGSAEYSSVHPFIYLTIFQTLRRMQCVLFLFFTSFDINNFFTNFTCYQAYLGWPNCLKIIHNFLFVLKRKSVCVMTEQRFFSVSGVSDFSRDIITINIGLLKEHVEAPFILSQRMSCNPVRFKAINCIRFILYSLLTCWRNFPILISFPQWSFPRKCRHLSEMGAAFWELYWVEVVQQSSRQK